MKFQKTLERETALCELSVGDTFRHADDSDDEVYLLVEGGDGGRITHPGAGGSRPVVGRDDRLTVHLSSGVIEIRSGSMPVVKLHVDAQVRRWTPDDDPKPPTKSKGARDEDGDEEEEIPL